MFANPSFSNGESRMVAMEANGSAYTLSTSVQYSAPTTGQTVVSNGAGTLIADPAGLLAALTITFPSSPSDGQRFTFCSTKVVTLLTMQGGTIKNPLLAGVANVGSQWVFSTAGNSWFRTY